MENLELGRKLKEIFIYHGAIQCGFCIPGMILIAKDYMDKNHIPDRKEIKKAVMGIYVDVLKIKRLLMLFRVWLWKMKVKINVNYAGQGTGASLDHEIAACNLKDHDNSYFLYP